MHPLKRAQIAHLKVDEASIKVPSKYADFVDIFSPNLAVELLKHTKINNHAIELVDDRQPPYGSIYSLGLVKLETLKVYIKNNLANGFIRSSKSPAGTPILLRQKAKQELKIMRKSLRSQQSDNQELISPIFGQRIIRLTRSGSTFHLARSNQCLPSDEDQGRQWIEESLLNPLWPFRVLSDAFWIDQHTGHFLGLH